MSKNIKKLKILNCKKNVLQGSEIAILYKGKQRLEIRNNYY
ncbi:hypothetical protein rpr22_0938 [Rickettsia prowazekii str. Rp22]|uniref:Uncharacterized protein n=1 Tax=Rickettsia prowazekii (strain Rp22) TaxID=449216 RepID=D5AYF9_RICPP|nr:hypothetical protein rpr22_0938 [Rickettsia prowazekii str. Rp22]AGJ01460.1 Glutamine ABC transporter ATP-binding protein [Rickettsia prowazekii str. NMRC Madrid E]AGJ02872.1 hypothetical protein H375_6470 [Rickettsia prowazekii str. Breinl]EOB09443.1 hypothetical protein H377_7470 [Rickettsia prowazekii str. Cairo 3]EOB10197.1 hypothetical protein H376_3450 [Rickettsia prowazekii str. GvF12]